jgi:hypothetical protein
MSELREELDGKIFLSSQLALLSSRHGKNALAYFYIIAYVTRLCAIFASLFYGDGPMTAWGLFVAGQYLSAHALPFVSPPKR